MAVDGKTRTKWLDSRFKANSGSRLVLTFSSAV